MALKKAWLSLVNRTHYRTKGRFRKFDKRGPEGTASNNGKASLESRVQANTKSTEGKVLQRRKSRRGLAGMDGDDLTPRRFCVNFLLHFPSERLSPDLAR
jgi:hypothetical protein